ncbi:MAG: hydrogenase nickel incorporation protein HypA/HybF [Frankiales bacterium]|jgi:hydrogenase nickel incorporation protein HypA/HybF|nr:hydrogenase nickel incorporation protein HypA/HybF [Frankiales bacterium]
MHELGMCESVLYAVQRRAGNRRVTGLRVHVGALNRVVEPAFVQSFTMVATGTVAEDAEIDLVIDPAEFRCLQCEASLASADIMSVCTQCGSTSLELVSGEQILLESISVESTLSSADA